MNRPKLSVCIPTYNRARFLETALQCISQQVEDRDDVEIVISDNASADTTPDIVRAYEGKLPRSRYFRWDETVPVDRNILKVVEQAEGEYCWVFGDDDALEPGAIQAVMDALSEGHDLYLLNSTVYDEDFVFIQKRPPLDLQTDTAFVFSDPRERLEYCKKALRLEAFFGFISTQVFRRDLWYRSIDRDQALFERFTGSRFLHAWLLLNTANVGRASFKYLVPPLVVHRFLRHTYAGTQERMTAGIVAGVFVGGFAEFADAAFGPQSPEGFHVRRVFRRDYPQPLRRLLALKLLSTTMEEKRGTALMANLLCSEAGLRGHCTYLAYRATPHSALGVLRMFYRFGRGVGRRVGMAPRPR